MTSDEARAALKALGMTQLELAEDLRKITGGKYQPQAVNRWFNERGPTDVCKVYLTLALRGKVGADHDKLSNHELIEMLRERLEKSS